MKSPKEKRGRPSVEDPKEPMTIRLNRSKIAHIKAKAKELNKTARQLVEERANAI